MEKLKEEVEKKVREMAEEDGKEITEEATSRMADEVSFFLSNLYLYGSNTMNKDDHEEIDARVVDKAIWVLRVALFQGSASERNLIPCKKCKFFPYIQKLASSDVSMERVIEEMMEGSTLP